MYAHDNRDPWNKWQVKMGQNIELYIQNLNSEINFMSLPSTLIISHDLHAAQVIKEVLRNPWKPFLHLAFHLNVYPSVYILVYILIF